MKQLLALLTLTIGLTATAIANNGNGGNNDNGTTQTDPEKPAKETTYKFSLKKSYFNIFNLFSVEPAKADTTRREEHRDEVTRPTM